MLKHPKIALFLGCAMAASLAAANSQAQTANTSGQAATLGEIIVTAQRRSENVQSVPISVSALTGAQLQAKGAGSSEDLTSLVPAVVFNAGVGGGQVTIRGIGGTNSGADPGNAIYIDGIYQIAPESNLFYLNAVDRIEVLKGPQGTLFGRNSTGGLVHIITRDPSTQKASAEMEVGYANYNTVSGNFYVNAPITDTLAVNVAAFGFDQRNGWGRNFATGNPAYLGYAWGIRGKAKWEAPDGKTDVILAAYYNKDKPIAFGPGTLPPGMLNVAGQGSVGTYNGNTNSDPYRLDEQYTIAATIHHDFGFARFTSITAYDSVHAPVYGLDADMTPAPILNVNLTQSFRTISQEFHLQSEEGGRLQWITGFLFLHDRNPGTFQFDLPPPPAGPGTVLTLDEISLKSYAVFGQATYAVTDDTKATLGLRYTHDLSRLVAPPNINQTAEAGKPTWRLALDHKFTSDVLGYVSYSRGFKSGLFNPTAPTHPSAAPETLDAYEVGLKTETFEHRLRVNAALFYYNFDNVQVQLFDPVSAVAYITNGGAAHSEGIDLDVAAEPIPGLTLTAGMSLMDTKFTSGFAPCAVLAPIGATVTNSCPLVGKRLPFAPKGSGSLGASYKLPSDVGDFVFSGNFSHTSGYFVDPSNFGPTFTPSSNMFNLSATWTSTSGHLNASVWGKNLLNQHIVSGYNVNSGVANISIGWPLAPLTFGGTVGYKF